MKYIARFFIFIFVVGIASCSDDFLESQPSELISASRMGEVSKFNPDIFNGQVAGLYTTMYEVETGGTESHADFGQKGYDIYSDLLSGDMVLGGHNYHHYEALADFIVSTDNTETYNYMPWRYYYRIIFGANMVIRGLGGNDVTPELELEKHQMGQAKAMRAYAYFYLMYLFNEEIDNFSAEAIPLYTDPDQQSLPKSTTQDIWNQIKSDLKEAISLLEGFSPSGKQVMSQDVAKGLLAYTYASIGDYFNAATVAQQVIDKGYKIIPISSVEVSATVTRNAFSYIDGVDADWIWGMDLTLDQSLDLISWWGQVDYYTYSYSWAGDPKLVDSGLLSSIRPTDVRSNWFDSYRYPTNKFYAEDRTAGKQRKITADYVYMRVEEMHLLKAEALYFSGDEAGARSALLELVNKRDTDPSYISSLTGKDLKEEIYHQWRIEMWGEGKSYLAMKRFKATIERKGHITYNGLKIPYNDTRLTLEIPYQEIQDNVNISE